jgi:hypothetical protein
MQVDRHDNQYSVSAIRTYQPAIERVDLLVTCVASHSVAALVKYDNYKVIREPGMQNCVKSRLAITGVGHAN